ncbi:MAG TPA: hypothetical protein VF414_08885, partial [Thermoanaerobaculia bacterium]
RSVDGGSTRQTVMEAVDVVRLLDDPKASSTLYAVCVERSSPGQQILFRSRDGGRSWRRILTGVGGFAPDPLRRGRLWAAQGSAILFSRNRGETWERAGTAPADVRTLAADPARPGLLLAGTHGVSGVVISFNGGRTWARYNVGLARMKRSQAGELIADPFVPGRFFALPLGWGGAFEITVPVETSQPATHHRPEATNRRHAHRPPQANTVGTSPRRAGPTDRAGHLE